MDSGFPEGGAVFERCFRWHGMMVGILEQFGELMNGISQFVQGAMKPVSDGAWKFCHRSSNFRMFFFLQGRQGLNRRRQIGRRGGKPVRSPSGKVFAAFLA